MPEVMYTAKDVSELIHAGIKARGLPEDNPPAAVVHLTALLGQTAVTFAELISDLPSELRGFDWMAVIFAGYAEFCDRAIVVDATES